MNITRRVIAISATIIGLGVSSFLAIKGSETALAWLLGIVGVIIAFYFGSTKNTPAN